MISDKALEIVKVTLPVVGPALDEASPLFYKFLFAAHPELEKHLFNRGNQAQGDQQRALAGAVGAYAVLLTSNEQVNIDSMMERIAHKHASLGITEDQYPIVYKYLFQAIAEVVGDAATPEVVDAWTEVYWDMADSLMSAEKELYAKFDVSPGKVWQSLVVVGRSQESSDTISLELADPDGNTLHFARPGQYVSVQVKLPDGAHQIRQYSLTRAPDRKSWGISIKAEPEVPEFRVPAGQVSNFIHGNVFEGDILRCSLPYGDLVLHNETSPLLLISAGIGCTPIIGLLHYLVRTHDTREVTVLHADRSMSEHAHRREMHELVDRLPNASLFHWYEDLGARSTTESVREGLIDLAEVAINPVAEVYLCGPPPFMNAVRKELDRFSIPGAQVHYEVFGPDTWAPSQIG